MKNPLDVRREQLDRMLQYFESELALLQSPYKEGVESRRNFSTVAVGVLSILAVLVTSFGQISFSVASLNPRPFEIISYIALGVIVLLIFVLVTNTIFDHQAKRFILKRESGLQIILHNLLYLKVTGGLIDLDGLEEVIKDDFRKPGLFSPDEATALRRLERIHVELDKLVKDIAQKDEKIRLLKAQGLL